MSKDIISIEKVLNSRCSSDFIGSKKSHWGTFIDINPQKKIINRIIRSCRIPRFSNGNLFYKFKEGYIFLGYENTNDPQLKRMLHIESGMQQQAIHLACTAFGIGTCIRNQGINGTEYNGKIITAKHQIRKMGQPYQSSNFSIKAPGPKKPFIIGKNLSEPLRNGEVECLSNLENLTTFNKSVTTVEKRDISQLLWAAKGRTPHLIRIHVWNNLWGLTIPTWGGGQNYTSVFLVKDRKLFRYINWTKKGFSLINKLFLNYAKWTRGNPTHDVQFVRNVKIQDQIDDANTAIILCQNEETGRALWEVGYMLENMLLQASGLDIYYESKIFKTEKISQLAKLGLKNAVAVMLL